VSGGICVIFCADAMVQCGRVDIVYTSGLMYTIGQISFFACRL